MLKKAWIHKVFIEKDTFIQLAHAEIKHPSNMILKSEVLLYSYKCTYNVDKEGILHLKQSEL